MVGAGRIELPTPAMSTQCSTTELCAHSNRKRAFSRSFRAIQAVPSAGYGAVQGPAALMLTILA
jgi:hypothetical protein